MAKAGRCYSLVVYTHMIDRWWPTIFVLGLGLLGLSWALYSWGFAQWRWLTSASLGGLNIFLGLLFLILRKSAYVQPFNDHLKLATPFLRLSISYKRFFRASSANFGSLFPPQSISKWQAEIVQPLSKMTALVIELNGHPMSQSVLGLFLSPLFFKDTTPHFVIVVNDWMRFSSELESLRTGTGPVNPQQKRNSSILSRLPSNKK